MEREVILRRRKMEREVILGFPQEIIEEILSRVPVKSLMKFRCVSKSWSYLIGSERFIKTHLEISSKSLSHQNIFLNPYRNSGRLFQQCSLLSLFDQLVINSVPFMDLNFIRREWEFIKIVGCCNGLVCIYVDNIILYLWNPSTRSYKRLPDDKEMWGKRLATYGFGYDESSNDYKVFCNFHGTRVGKYDYIGRVYSIKSNSWKSSMSDWDSFLYAPERGKFASGNLHWIVTNDSEWNIVSFDLKSEVYRLVELPSVLKGGNDFNKTLGVIEGRLSLVCDYPQTQIDIWVMKESWEKVATLANMHHPLEGKFLSPIAWGPNGEIILFYEFAIRLYNSKDDGDPWRIKISSLYLENDDGFPWRNKISSIKEMDVCVESLVSIASDDDEGKNTSLNDENNIQSKQVILIS